MTDIEITSQLRGEAREGLQEALYEIKRVIVGQDAMLERLLVSLLAGGHVLLEGVPGLAKTLTVKTLAAVLGGSYSRIQFTPDLVPSDLVGTRVWRPDTGSFDTELGPVFHNFLLADEINRAPAKVQSALLEVMQEQQVTIGGTTHKVPLPFIVMATQNPIESEGTYPLPEAQVDRFLMKILVDYPSVGEEAAVVGRSLQAPASVRECLALEDLYRYAEAAKTVSVDRATIGYAVSLADATRNPANYGLEDMDRLIEFGASPRGPIGVVQAARVLALLRGRGHVEPEDIRDLATDVLRHRVVLSYDALSDGLTVDELLERVLSAVPEPGTDRRCARLRAGHRRLAEERMTAEDRITAGGGAAGLLEPPAARQGPGPMAPSLIEAMDLALNRVVTRTLPGDRRAAGVGLGTELAQLRPYETGDDVRHIDAAATARTGIPHVRLHVPERALTTWIVLDVSPSMAFGTARRLKADVAEGAALVFGRLGVRRAGSVGMVAFGAGGLRVLPPRGSKPGMVALRRALGEGISPDGQHDSKGLGDALDRAARLARQPGLVVVISDFRDQLDWERPLGSLRVRHSVLAVEGSWTRARAICRTWAI